MSSFLFIDSIKYYLQANKRLEVVKLIGLFTAGIIAVMTLTIRFINSESKSDEVEALTNTSLNLHYSKAIELLGHDNMTARLGAIHALHQIVLKYKNFDETVLNILCSYVREITTQKDYQKIAKSKPTNEIQTILDILFKSQKKLTNENVYTKTNIANLNGAYLCGADLYKAKMIRIDMVGAILDNADLTLAQFQWGNLDYVSMKGAILNKTCFEGATLFNSNMQYAKLRNTHFEGANLMDANLQGISLSDWELKKRECMANFEGAILCFANFEDAELQNIHFEGANLTGAKFNKVKLYDTYLNGANLTGADIIDIKIEDRKIGNKIKFSHEEFNNIIDNSQGKETIFDNINDEKMIEQLKSSQHIHTGALKSQRAFEIKALFNNVMKKVGRVDDVKVKSVNSTS